VVVFVSNSIRVELQKADEFAIAFKNLIEKFCPVRTIGTIFRIGSQLFSDKHAVGVGLLWSKSQNTAIWASGGLPVRIQLRWL